LLPSLLGTPCHFITFELTHRWIFAISAIFWPLPGKATSPAPAEQLGIAPPTLTRQIQDMENELGTRLFVRQTREVSLTEAGAALLIEAEATVRQFEYAQYNAQRAGRRGYWPYRTGLRGVGGVFGRAAETGASFRPRVS